MAKLKVVNVFTKKNLKVKVITIFFQHKLYTLIKIMYTSKLCEKI